MRVCGELINIYLQKERIILITFNQTSLSHFRCSIPILCCSCLSNQEFKLRNNINGINCFADIWSCPLQSTFFINRSKFHHIYFCRPIGAKSLNLVKMRINYCLQSLDAFSFFLGSLASNYEWDTLDPCYGHSDASKQYHYHAVS